MPALFLFICGTQKESPQLRSFAALTDACKPFCKQICSQVNLFKSKLVRFLSCLRCKPCEFFHKPNTDSPFTSHPIAWDVSHAVGWDDTHAVQRDVFRSSDLAFQHIAVLEEKGNAPDRRYCHQNVYDP